MATATRLSIEAYPRAEHISVTAKGVTAGSLGFRGTYLIGGVQKVFKADTEDATDQAAATYAATLP